LAEVGCGLAGITCYSVFNRGRIIISGGPKFYDNRKLLTGKEKDGRIDRDGMIPRERDCPVFCAPEITDIRQI
jgi:hypothetical protein